ncbi:MAG: RagB/SusD family nutrient uptake outer membrane protein, partial [Phycisphaerae bacterium]
MKNIIHKTVLLITISLLVISCEDFLDKEPNNYSSSGFYKSEAAIKDGVSGVYNSLYIDLAYNLPYSAMLDHWTGLAMERAENSTIGAGGALTPDNGSVLTWWTTLYRIVARSNSVIKGSEPYIENLEGLSKQYLAEARVLRAYAYYNLISTYGNVPF